MKIQTMRLSLALLSVFTFNAALANEYSDAYNCSMESLQVGGSGGAASCVGNARDPSAIEIRAYADAERDFKARANGTANCTFEFAVWIANGSRVDDFQEGAQTLTKLSDVAFWISKNRDVYIYDSNGNKINPAIINQWFVRQGEEVYLTAQARKQCPDKL